MGECAAVSLAGLAPRCQNPNLEPVECAKLDQCFSQFMCSGYSARPFLICLHFVPSRAMSE